MLYKTRHVGGMGDLGEDARPFLLSPADYSILASRLGRNPTAGEEEKELQMIREAEVRKASVFGRPSLTTPSERNRYFLKDSGLGAGFLETIGSTILKAGKTAFGDIKGPTLPGISGKLPSIPGLSRVSTFVKAAAPGITQAVKDEQAKRAAAVEAQQKAEVEARAKAAAQAAAQGTGPGGEVSMTGGVLLPGMQTIYRAVAGDSYMPIILAGAGIVAVALIMRKR